MSRDLYQQAIEALPDKEARGMCMEFAELEKSVGEVDRARSIYSHCSQFCDPRTDEDFWRVWENFEVNHGNQDTYREMLRLKRSVAASYNTGVSFAASEMLEQDKKES